MAQRTILFTGASGFIGGTILNTFLVSNDPAIKGAKYSALVRGDDKAAYFKSIGVEPILFNDLEEADIIRKAASTHDTVINCATGYATIAARALIEGLGQHQKATGKNNAIFIHTSGTSNLGDKPISKKFIEPRFAEGGRFSDHEDIYAYEKMRESLEAYSQRTTDLAVVETGAKENVKTYIMMPPTIYGKGTGNFHKRSMQVPTLVGAALKQGRSEMIEQGQGRMDHVHVQDLSVLFEMMLSKLLAGEQLASGDKGIYFAESGQHTWREIHEGIGKAGKELGIFDTADVRSLPFEEGQQKFAIGPLTPEHVEVGFALNSVTKADRAREMGWKPKWSRDDFLGQFREEIEVAQGKKE